MPLFAKPKQVALYTRVSTEEQKADLQLLDLKDYVKRRGYTIYMVYGDIVSGVARERQALNRLMEDAKKRRFDIVLVWKFDRFARSLKMLVDSLALFEELGIDFISYTQLPSLKTSNPLIILRKSQISARSTGHI